MGSKIFKIIIVFIILGVLTFLIFNSISSDFYSQNIGAGEEKQIFKQYQNEKHGFMLKLSENTTTTNIENEEGDLILIEKKELGSNESNQIQINIASFDEDIDLTAERIKKDIPDIKMREEEKVKIGGISAIKFNDLDQNTKEIWFIKSGFLYQVSSFLKDEKFLEEVIGGWGWVNK